MPGPPAWPFVPQLALAAPDFGLALWGQSIGDHVGLTHKPRGESPYRSRTESQVERSLRRSGWSLPDLVVGSISELLCRPCALHEGRIRVGALCRWSWVYTAAGASGWPTLAPSLEPDPATLRVPAIAAGRV